jgi:hypothetical protein
MIAVERQLGSGRGPNGRTVRPRAAIHSRNGNTRNSLVRAHFPLQPGTYFTDGFSEAGASAPPITAGKKWTLESVPDHRFSSGHGFSRAVAAEHRMRLQPLRYHARRYLTDSSAPPEDTPVWRLGVYKTASSHSPLTTSHSSLLPGVPKSLRVFGWLPETVNRVETGVSYRKHSLASGSTRDVPAHEKQLFLRSNRLRRLATVARP